MNFRIFIFSVCLLFLTPSVHAAEQINTFNATVSIDQDTTVTIDEFIEYQTDESKHGIYRYVPYRYNINGLRFSTDVELGQIKDENGDTYQVKESREGDFLNWRIGDPDSTFTGKKIYRIIYQVSDIVKQYDGYDELYLDVVGEGWQFPVNNSQVTINSPFAEIEEVTCFAGEYGSLKGDCHYNFVSEQKVEVLYDHQVTYGENFTVVVKLKRPNDLVFPSNTDRFLKMLRDNWYMLLMPLPLLAMFYLWYTKGRDKVFISQNIFDQTDKPVHLKPLLRFERIPMVYQPLHDLTPGEAGAIIDEKVNNRDIVAEIIDLARKKYLKIKPITKKKLIFNVTDYTFIKLLEPDDSLPDHQKYLMEKLFKSGKEVKLSKLKGSFYTTMNKVRKMIYESAHSKKLFTQNPQKTKAKYAGIVSAVIVVTIMVLILAAQTRYPVVVVVTAMQFFLVPFFSMAMVQKSAVGHNYYMQAKGLKETINRGSWRQKIQEKNMFFDEVLPFAISFNVIEKLAKDMDALNVEAPSYLASSGWHADNFTRSLNDFGSQATKSLAYNPSSSSSSGSSGFSSGGGFSGGGFSGGGGGSW